MDPAPGETPAATDRRAPPRWRRVIPHWLRALIWVEEGGKFDAFLSYAWEADRLFAPLLQEVLHSFLRPFYRLRALRVFRDLNNLPASADLWTEIFKRIDSSRTFVVLASPAAARSGGMEKEAAHWVQHHDGRNVLILVTEGDDADVEFVRQNLLPTSLSGGSAVPLLCDLRAVRSTLVAAPSSVEHRSALIEAMRQPLLALHETDDWGALRGREASIRRQLRGAIMGTVGVLSAALVMSVWFWTQAQAERDTAQRQLKISESLRLARASDDAVAQPQRRTLLALRSVAGFTPASPPPLPSEHALWRALGSMGGLALPLPGSTAQGEPVVSPDGKWLLVGDEKGSCGLWDLTQVRSEPTARVVDCPLGGLANVAFSPDSRLLAMSGLDDDRVLLWHVDAAQTRPGALAGAIERATALRVSPDGRWLVADGAGRERVVVWDLRAPERLRSMPVERGMLGQASFSPDGRWLAAPVGNPDPRVVLWDMLDESSTPVIEASGAHTVLFTADARHLSVAGGPMGVRIWRFGPAVPVELPLSDITFAQEASTFLAGSPDGRWLAAVPYVGDSARLIDLAATTPTATILAYDRIKGAKHLAFSPDARWLALAGDANLHVYLWRLQPERPSARRSSYPSIVVAGSGTCSSAVTGAGS